MKKFAKRLLVLVICFVMIMANVSMDARATFALDGDGPSASEPAPGGDNPGEPGEPGNPGGDDETVPPGGEPVEPPVSDIGQKIIESSDILFGDNGNNPANTEEPGPRIKLAVTSPTGEFLAGSTVKYLIEYRFKESPNWKEGYDLKMTYYDLYEKNRISFTLPEGLLISKVPAAYQNVMTVIENPDHSHTYVFDIEDKATGSGSSYTFEVQAYICGNGTENAIRSFNMQDTLSFSTEFTVLDKSSEPYAPLKTYKQSVKASPDNFSTTSPDVWGVKKDATSVKVNRATMTADVDYVIRVGLMDGDQMITATAAYTRLGRDAIKYMTVTEKDLKAVIRNLQGLDGKSPELVTATIIKAGVPDGSAMVLPSGAARFDLTDGDFALYRTTVEDRECTIGDDGKGTVSTKLNSVPSYTEYNVHATYKITEDMIQHFENAQGKIDFENTAVLDYQLENKSTDQKQSNARTDGKLPALEPSKFMVQKDLVDYHGTVRPYNNEYGKITYTISSVDGSTFKVYNENKQPITGTLTSYNQLETNKTYYLTPGIPYVVTESFDSTRMLADTDNWEDVSYEPTEGGFWVAKFRNIELAADIVVNKVDNAGNPVKGAVFRLTGNGVDQTKTSDDSGRITFTKIPYGQYNLEETSAPSGYSGSFRETVVIDKNDTLTYTAINSRNFAAVSLTKYLGVRQTGTLPKANASYSGEFILQRSTDGVNWTDVSKDMYGADISTKVNSNGMISASVAPFDGSGNAYSYRFMEKIPEGCYDPANPDATVTYSSVVRLVDANGNALTNTVNVDMFNRKKVSVTVNKEFWDVDSTGKLVKNANKTVEVTLYKLVNGTFEQVGDKKQAGTAEWANLIGFENGSAVQFYVSEAEVQGYKLDKQQAGTGIQTVNGVEFIPVTFANDREVSAVKTLYNVEQLIPVVVKKENYYTEQFVNGTGFSITLNGATVSDSKSGLELKDVMITEATGVVVYLAPGKSYKLNETVNNSGMTNKSGELTIDLTNVTPSTYNDRNSTTGLKTYVLKNAPDPSIKITKKDSQSNSTMSAGAAVYTVYKKLENGKFEAVKNASGAVVTISSNAASTATPVRLPAGEYYLAETKVPNGYIDPNKVPAEYTKKYSNLEIGTTTDDKTYTFAKVNVTNANKNGTSDNVFTATLYNIPNKGSLKVRKFVDGKLTDIQGFPVVVKNGDTTVKTGNTGSNGTVTFTNLPIYDADGNKITYTIDEGTLSKDQQEVYTKVSSPQTAVLSVGTSSTANRTSISTTEKDTSGAYLTIENATFTSVEVNKYYIHSWDSQYITMLYPMSGAGIALYELDGDTYKLVDTAVTVAGNVSFDGLRRDTSYALVEFSSPEPNMEPFDNGEYKLFAADENGNALETIPAADLEKYNARTLSKEVEGQTPRKANTVLDYLVNSDRWVQFDITKFIDNDILGKDIQDHGRAADISFDKKYDNAVYNLYRKVVTEGTDVEFNTSTQDGWTLMGTYTSGTAYGVDGERLEGRFLTNVDDKAASNVVYMLVEVDEGPNGAVMNPYFQYTFWKNVGTEYEVTLTGKDSASNEIVRNKAYQLSAINHDYLLNSRVEPDDDGGNATLIAAIRIAKWADSFTEEGLPKEEYTPLPNAKFSIYLDRAGETELESMTVGLDNTDPTKVKAWAQGTAYGLHIENGSSSDKGTLTDYAKIDDDGNPVSFEIPRLVKVSENPNYTILGVPVYIRETSAPEKYSYEAGMFPMYLCFVYYHGVGGTYDTTVFNDAYFVTEAEGNYPLISTQVAPAAVISWVEDEKEMKYGQPMYRIVDYPMEDTLVRITKYGYTPTNDTKGLTSAELDEVEMDRTALSGVVMQIKRFDDESGSYKFFNYVDKAFTNDSSKAEFTTGRDGAYMFAAGLPEGKYQVIESDLKSYKDTYINAYDSWTNAREFTVGKEAVAVTMYNPKMAELVITKKDTEGNTVNGVTFSLTANGNTVTATTGDNGEAKFENLPNGTYKLAETVPASLGLTGEYFALSVTGTARDLATDGVFVGYTLESKDVEGGKDRVVSAVGLTSASGEIEVVNPKLASFSVKKVAEGTGALLEGAQFKYYYMPFSKWSGEMNAVSPLENSTGWTLSSNTLTTGKDGIATATGLVPGIYAVYETVPPAGYDIITDSNGNAPVHIVVLTGGMDVDVKGLDVKLKASTEGQITVENRPQVGIKATKEITSGLVDKNTLSWSVKIGLYDEVGVRIGEAAISDSNADPVAFSVNGKPVLLSQGKKYYIAEDDVTGYKLATVKINGTEKTPVNGRYEVVAGNANDVSVSVKNTYMRGTVKFMKVDREEFTKLLPGASFAVCIENENGVPEPVSGSSVTEVLDEDGNGTGIYVADVLLVSEDTTEYVIVETAAPDGYVLIDGTKLYVELSAEENVVDWSNESEANRDKYLSNVKGWHLDITKYRTLLTATDPATAEEGTVSFTLLHFDKEKQEWVIEKQNVPVDGSGKVSFLLTPGDDYAFFEASFNSGKFLSLDSWAVDSKNEEGALVRTAVDTQKVKVGESEFDAIILYSVDSDFTYSAFNVPALKVKIVKADVGGWPANVIPTATFKVFELEESLPADKAAAEEIIAELLESGEAVYTDVTDLVEGNTTYKIWDRCDPTKNYVVVETEVAAKSGTYNTLNKDDRRVVWYKAINATTNPDVTSGEIPVYELDNVYGEATAELKKTVVEKEDTDEDIKNDVVDGKVESLLTGKRNVVYVLKPTVEDHNQPLASFVIEDTGLTFDTEDEIGYEINSIVIEKAKQKAENFLKDVEDAKISALVTWLDKDGMEHSATVSDLSSDAAEAATVATTGAVSFTVEYFSAEVEEATDGKYKRGAEFAVGNITVNVTVEQQQDGTVEKPVKPAGKFTNTSALHMTYPKWNASGTGTTEVKVDKTATADVLVKGLDYPVVKITKSSDPADAVEVGSLIEYTFNVVNNSDVPFVDPVIVDILPTGVTYADNWAIGFSSGVNITDLDVTKITGVPTITYSTVEGAPAEGDAETAVVLSMKGTIEAHSMMDVTITANVGSSTVIYGDKIYNPVFLSSSKHTYHTVDNPYGYSFRLSDGSFPGTLSEEATKLSTLAGNREVGVHEALGKYANNDTREYVWVDSSNEVKLIMKSSITLVKSIQGDQDTGFSAADNFLATSTRTNSTPGDETEGFVNYRLAVSNGTETEKYFLVAGDVLPARGDVVESNWNAVMDEITSVVFDGQLLKKDKDYFVYYYTGAVGTDAENAVKSAMTSSNKWSEDKAWPQGKVEIPAGWYADTDSALEGKNVSAFVVIFNHDLVLRSGTSYVITYHTLVEDIPDDIEFAKVAFENCVNRFYANWEGSLEPLRSNEVSAVIMDGRVSVGGDLWIDEDMDGVQETTGNRRDYSDYEIIKKLISKISFSIADKRSTAGAVRFDKGGENALADISEGIKHFSFDDLGSAIQVRDPLYIDEELNPAALKTTDPYRYALKAEISDSSLLDIFAITVLGEGHYMSDDPDEFPQSEISSMSAVDNFRDNNFYETITGVYETKPFYIRYSAIEDISKDIGFTMVRGLEVNKVDEEGKPMGGVKFSLHGPFDEDEAAEGGSELSFTIDENGVYVLDPNGEETLLETDENGKLTIDGLNWWKEYVIVEEETLQGYSLAKGTAEATATGTVIEALTDEEGEDLGNMWVLKIPGTEKTEKFDRITVTNNRPDPTEAVIEAGKVLEHLKLKADMFSFNLMDEDGELLETVTNDDEGRIAFSPIEYTETGVHTYYVSEVIEYMKGVVYDTTVFEVTVTVEDDHGALVATVSSPEAPVFINTYIPDTGDDEDVHIYGGLAAASLLAMILLGRRKKEEEN
ncbi:MAG: Cna B-type domain-containing protein [Clostridia bacterium]|nr:Cna B-type domain-containing protein [Clostridia bacterium]